MERDRVEAYKLAKKNERKKKKRFGIWLLAKLFSQDTAGSADRADSSIHRSIHRQSQRVISFILSAHRASHIIKENNGSTITSFDGLRLFLFAIAPPSTRSSEELNKKRTQDFTKVVFMLTILT